MRTSYQFKDASNCQKELRFIVGIRFILVGLDSGSSPGTTKSPVFFPRINRGTICFFGIDVTFIGRCIGKSMLLYILLQFPSRTDHSHPYIILERMLAGKQPSFCHFY